MELWRSIVRGEPSALQWRATPKTWWFILIYSNSKRLPGDEVYPELLMHSILFKALPIWGSSNLETCGLELFKTDCCLISWSVRLLDVIISLIFERAKSSKFETNGNLINGKSCFLENFLILYQHSEYCQHCKPHDASIQHQPSIITKTLCSDCIVVTNCWGVTSNRPWPSTQSTSHVAKILRSVASECLDWIVTFYLLIVDIDQEMRFENDSPRIVFND